MMQAEKNLFMDFAVGGLSFSTIQKKGHRPVIDEMNLHPGLKLSSLNRNTLLFQSEDQLFIEAFRCGWFFSLCERRPSSLAAVAIEGELRDEQHLTTRLSQRKVEFSRGILEDSEIRKFRDHK